ncbi:MAG: hypothetical protein Q9190_004749 [Brigantiaea leucoxantha]
MGPGSIETEGGKRPGKARKTKKVKSVHRGNAEAEGVPSLTSLRAGYPQPPPGENETAASAPSIRLPARETQAPTRLDTSNGWLQGESAKKSSKKSSRTKSHSALEGSASHGNALAKMKDLTSSNKKKSKERDKPISHSSETPKAVLDLDDIDENDEDIAQFYHEYENLEPSRSSAISQVNSLEAGDSMDFTDTAIDNSQRFLDPAPKDSSSTFRPASPERGTAGKGKRKRQPTLDLPDSSADQELLNGTGQHALDIDFGAFDEMLKSHGLDLANPFDDGSDHDLRSNASASDSDRDQPLRFRMSDESSSVQSQTESAIQSSGKPRPSSVPKPDTGQGRKDQTFVNDSTSAYVSPYSANAGQQDRAFGGADGTPKSPSLDTSRDQVACQETPHSHQLESSHSAETTPSPISKPSELQGSGQRGRDSDSPPNETAAKGGPFSRKEIQRLESFCSQYCEENRISQKKFNDMIHSRMRGRPDVVNLFAEIHSVLPSRTRQSVLRFCKRHFHNFSARGTWTGSDDERLKSAVAQLGKSWIKVGERIDRFPEDCRDRFRNYHYNAENRNNHPWSVIETKRLIKAVDECIRLMKSEQRKAKEAKYFGRDLPASESELDEDTEMMKLVNWQIVSEKMGGTKSRLQCSTRWARLKDKSSQDSGEEVEQVPNSRGNARKRANPLAMQRRMERAMKKLGNMRAGDKFDFLRAFIKCGADSEKHIPWKFLASQELPAKWSTLDVKAAFALFKDEVPGSSRLPYQDMLNRVYLKIIEQNCDLNDRWDPKVHGDVRKRKPKKQEQQKKKAEEENPPRSLTQQKELVRRRRSLKKRQLEDASKIKSSEFVRSDDDETEEGGQSTAQTHESSSPPKDERSLNKSSEHETASSISRSESVDQDSDSSASGSPSGNQDADSLFDEAESEWSQESENSPSDDKKVEQQQSAEKALSLDGTIFSATHSQTSSSSSSSSSTDSSVVDFAVNGGLDGELVDRLQLLRNA